jgi:prepilin-type N-terminal cleavage/methylation domain-containing protein
MSKKAFTLVEVLVVVVIIGILSSLIYIGVGNSAKKAQDAKIVNGLASLNNKLLSYYNLSGTFQYPIGETCLEDDTSNSFLKSALGVTVFPQHPEYNESNKVCYFYQSTGDEYSILVKSVNGGYVIADSTNTKVTAIQDSCDSGWIPFGNKCVMKYEAKNVSGAVSQADGTPWASITQADAKAACEAIGAHLITNAEWMALARDIEKVDANWTGGAVNSGMIKRGNVGITDSGSYNGADPEYGTGRDTKAELTLSNGETIWDFSGNVWEWVDMTKETSEVPNYSNTWREINSITYPSTLPLSYVSPINTSLISTTNGIGKIYTNNGLAYCNVANCCPSGGTGYCLSTHAFLRGGYWSTEVVAGVFALSLNNSPSIVSTGIGFRCVR